MFTKQQTTNSFARYLHNQNNTKSRTIFIVVKIEDAVRLLFGLFTPDMFLDHVYNFHHFTGT